MKYFREGLYLDTIGISPSIESSVNRGTFVYKYKPVKNLVLDSILEKNVCREIWVEKSWFHKRWGNFDVSNSQYTFIMEIEGIINNGNSGNFNQKWNVQLANTSNLESLLACTRNYEKFILKTFVKSTTQLDTLVFNVKKFNTNTNIGEIKFIRLK